MTRTLLALCFLTAVSRAQKIFEQPLSPRIANYSIQAELLPAEKAVRGFWVLDWWNATRDTVRELQFHLYLNAFKNDRSTYMRETRGEHRGSRSQEGKDDRGYVDVQSLELADGTGLKDRIEFISPDDGNPDDRTVIRVPLPDPLPPGSSIRLSCRFFSKLPRVSARTGFTDDDFFMIGQWYPKIGVWKDGQWNCHQFHGLSEFFADFGVYALALTVPSGYTVAANGVLQSKDEADSSVTYRYRQEDVIDAVWCAARNVQTSAQQVMIDRSGRRIDVSYLWAPGREVMREHYEKFVPWVINYFDSLVGEYPYPNLTIVDVPEGEEFTAGGMEYPTLITTGSYLGPARLQELIGFHYPEIVTFHEFAHNYFQAMVASNEFEEPWLDEGFTTFLEHKALERYFRGRADGEYADLGGLGFTSLDYHRSSYVTHPRDGTIVGASWVVPRGFFQTALYSKPVLVLGTLENMLGEETMRTVLRTYVERWKFRHPTTADFVQVAEKVSGRDLGHFFRQFLYENKTIDLEVVRIDNEREGDPAGWFGESERMEWQQTESDSADTSAGRYVCNVSVRNRGDGVLEVPLVVRFADGDSATAHYDGSESFKVYRFHAASPVVYAALDPARTNLLDLSFTNNARLKEPENGGIWRMTLRLLFWMQNVFAWLAALA